MEQARNKILYWIMGLLITIVGFFCVNLFTQIADIQKGIVELQLKFTELQATIITREEVKEIVQYEIYKHKGKL